jgi:hypothetical protein
MHKPDKQAWDGIHKFTFELCMIILEHVVIDIRVEYLRLSPVLPLKGGVELCRSS